MGTDTVVLIEKMGNVLRISYSIQPATRTGNLVALARAMCQEHESTQSGLAPNLGLSLIGCSSDVGGPLGGGTGAVAVIIRSTSINHRVWSPANLFFSSISNMDLYMTTIDTCSHGPVF